MSRFMISTTCLILLTFLGFSVIASAEKNTVKIMKMEDLVKKMDEITPVDVRSKFEYDIMHIKNAENILYSERLFPLMLEDNFEKDRKIVFYCNANPNCLECSMSFKAAQFAVKNGYTNVFVLDKGIFDWAEGHPQDTIYKGGETLEVKMLQMCKSNFQKKKIDYKKFVEKASTPGAIIFDIREINQRVKAYDKSIEIDIPLPEGISHQDINVALFIRNIVNKGKHKDKLILAYDLTGMQLRTLHLVMEEAGYENFYLLDEGVYGVTGQTPHN